MVNINLIPDIKQERLKSRKTKRLVLGSAGLAAAIGVGVPLVLFLLITGQKALINNQSNLIEQRTAELNEIENLATVVTVENNMSQLTSESDKGFHLPQFLNQALARFSTDGAIVKTMELDTESGVIEIGGDANTVSDVYRMAEYMRTTSVTPANEEEVRPVFTSVTVEVVDPGDEQTGFFMSATVDTSVFERQPPEISNTDADENQEEGT